MLVLLVNVKSNPCYSAPEHAGNVLIALALYPAASSPGLSENRSGLLRLSTSCLQDTSAWAIFTREPESPWQSVPHSDGSTGRVFLGVAGKG